ncbi:MAG: L,D-transpeptidase [Desulfobacterales bacterium]|nr:MAG: L,D-transpeptidase [Desulfobacterales bacterium]
MVAKFNRSKRHKKDTRFIVNRAAYILIIAGLILLGGVKNQLHSQEPVLDSSAKPVTEIQFEGESWNGPILFQEGNGEPVHLILVEKAIQKLFLYRYDGQYRLLKSYTCSTGEKQGKKREEKDEKTPEGIYFNVSVYRDSKVTIFGDRAFGLNYPDVFDDMSGNTGSGIFIHGSNRNIKPFSTNGCVVLSNADLADLDKLAPLEKTPFIIGEHLLYRLSPAANEMSELIPFFKQAMVPERYLLSKSEFQHITVLKYQDRIVAFGEVRIKEADDLRGFSRLYLIQPTKNFLVLLKREWSEF